MSSRVIALSRVRMCARSEGLLMLESLLAFEGLLTLEGSRKSSVVALLGALTAPPPV